MFLLVTIFSVLSLLLGVSAECENKGGKYVSGNNTDLDAALQFLQENDVMMEKMMHKSAEAEFNYESNLTDYNKELFMKASNENAKFGKDTWKTATSFAWKEFKNKNETAYRWFKSLSFLEKAALPEDKFLELTDIITEMQDVYSKAKVCKYLSDASDDCTLSLDPDLKEIMRDSTDYDQLKYYWSEYRDATGRKVKGSYKKYVDFLNMAACQNGFSDAGEMWREAYESDTLVEELEELLETMKPFYQQLHAYVRRKLIDKYSNEHIKEDGPIPAHLLGMFGQVWKNTYPIVAPFPEKTAVDVTGKMKEKGMTPLSLFKMSEDFFTSLGLFKMTPEFWNFSVIEKPTDREVICHPSAWDLYDNDDFRVKMCTRIDMRNLITIHHEMGHIQYYQQYKDQPVVFRNGANPGFHEAIGDTMALSVSTQDHLKKVDLLDKVVHDPETEINNLLKMALDKVAFPPYSFLVDNWRWKVFSGSIKNTEWNTQWWNMRLKYQGLCPPVLRTENDLDVASKYHIVADVPYIRYFVSYVIQFQFLQALCEEAGHVGPLHTCDIYENKKAGKLLSDMLRLGSSVHWREAMKKIAKGKTDRMDASAVLDYFKPLYEWLKEQNKGEFIGWKSADPMICP